MDEPYPRLATAHTVLGSFLLVMGLGHLGVCAWVLHEFATHEVTSAAIPFVGFAMMLAVGSAVAVGIGGLDLAVGRRLRSGGPEARVAAAGLAVPNLIFAALGGAALLVDVIAVLGI